MKHRVYFFAGILLLLLTTIALLLRLLPSPALSRQSGQSEASSTGVSSELPEPRGTPTGTPNPTLTGGPAPRVLIKARSGEPMKTVIEGDWPETITLNQSNYVSLSLDEVIASKVDQSKVGHLEVTPQIDFGIRGVPVQDAFGPDYDVSASADLVSTAFEIKPVITGFQPIDRGKVSWEWQIMPENSGPQSLTAVVFIQWKSKKNGEILTRQFWRGHLPIEVRKPIVTFGQIDIFALLTGTAGFGFLIKGATRLYEKMLWAGEHKEDSGVDAGD